MTKTQTVIAKTQIIAGRTMMLVAGTRYYASRPIAERGRITYPVTIRRLYDRSIALNIPGLTYEQANAFINEFNNEPGNSWAGRIW